MGFKARTPSVTMQTARVSGTSDIDNFLASDALLCPRTLHPGPGPYVAILLCLAVIGFMVLAAFLDIPITSYGVVLSNTGQTVYTAGTTILAGAIAAFIVGQVTELWALDILYVANDRACGGGETCSPDTLEEGSFHTSAIARKAKARTVIGIGSLLEKGTYWPQTLSNLVIGLITTCLVVCLSPTVYYTTRQADEWMVALNRRVDANGAIISTLNHGCVGIQNDSIRDLTPSQETYPIGNGQQIYVDTRSCNPYTLNPSGSAVAAGFAYSMKGVPIRPGAIGVPVIQNASTILGNASSSTNSIFEIFAATKIPDHISGLWGPGQFVQGEACLPVLARNPVACRSEELTPSTANCSLSVAGPNGVKASICENTDEAGRATYVVTGTNHSNFGNYSYDEPSASLHEAPISDGDWLTNRSIICQVDVVKAQDYRTIRMDFLGQLNGESSQRVVDLGDDTTLEPSGPFNVWSNIQTPYAMSGSRASCSPVSLNGRGPYTTTSEPDVVLSFAAASPWIIISQFLNHSTPADFLTTVEAESQNGSGFLFNDSRNALEDSLGVYVGAAISQYYFSDQNVACRSADVEACGLSADLGPNTPNVVFTAASATMTSTRVGSGRAWAVVCGLPTVYSFFLLCWLLRRRIVWAKVQETGIGVRQLQSSSDRLLDMASAEKAFSTQLETELGTVGCNNGSLWPSMATTVSAQVDDVSTPSEVFKPAPVNTLEESQRPDADSEFGPATLCFDRASRLTV